MEDEYFFHGHPENEISYDPHSPTSRSPRGGDEGDSRKHEREENSDNSDPLPKRQELEDQNEETPIEENFPEDPPSQYEEDQAMEFYDEHHACCARIDQLEYNLDSTHAMLAQLLPNLHAQIPEIEGRVQSFQQFLEGQIEHGVSDLRQINEFGKMEIQTAIQGAEIKLGEMANDLRLQIQNKMMSVIFEEVQNVISGFKDSILEEVKKIILATANSKFEEMKHEIHNDMAQKFAQREENFFFGDSGHAPIIFPRNYKFAHKNHPVGIKEPNYGCDP